MSTNGGAGSGLNPKNQETLQRYYDHTNVGDFLGAVQFLSEDVVYRMPGDKAIVPYAGEWRGRDEVVKLFKTFMSSFWMVQMSETLVLTAPNQLLAFNDEAFKARSTGRFFRTGVVHHMHFDDNHQIRALDTYFDTMPPEQAFSNLEVSTEPMLEAPVPSATEADAEAVRDLVTRFCDAGLDPSTRRPFLADNAVLVAPGSADRTAFSGAWMGSDQVVEFYEKYDAALADRRQTVGSVIVNGGWAGVVSTESGRRGDGQSVELRKVELFLVSGGKIAQAYVYVDTARLAGAAPSVAHNLELTRRLYDEVWSKQRYDLIPELIAPDHMFHMPDGTTFNGREAYKGFVSTYATAFPDMRIEIADLWGTPEQIANRIIFHGTQNGQLEAIAPTGKTVVMSGQHIARIANGMFVETWGNFDGMGLMRQLGVLPAPTD